MQYQEGPYKLKSMFLWPKSKVTASPDFRTLDWIILDHFTCNKEKNQ